VAALALDLTPCPAAAPGRATLVLLEPRSDDGLLDVDTPANDGQYPARPTYHYDPPSRKIRYEEYHPYGTSAYRAVDSTVEVSARRYRYTGMERDEETGLGYHSARYYAPWLGRWTSADPIGLAGGLNLFEYAASNPVVLSDSEGTSPSESTPEFRQNDYDPGSAGGAVPWAEPQWQFTEDTDDEYFDEVFGEREIVVESPSEDSAFVQEVRERHAEWHCTVPATPLSDRQDGPSMSVNRGGSVADFSQTDAGRRQAAALFMANNGMAAIVRMGLEGARHGLNWDVSDETLNVVSAGFGVVANARGGSMGGRVAGNPVQPPGRLSGPLPLSIEPYPSAAVAGGPSAAVSATPSASGGGAPLPNSEIIVIVGTNNRGSALEGAAFAQKTFGSMFSRGGAFAGQSVDDVTAALRSGAISPSEVLINYIVRDGNTLILNTRSAQALEAAGIPRSEWNAVDRTGQEMFENMLTGQLQRNGLTSAGTATVRRSGGI
jgi:RHS repeat-associated protein